MKALVDWIGDHPRGDGQRRLVTLAAAVVAVAVIVGAAGQHRREATLAYKLDARNVVACERAGEGYVLHSTVLRLQYLSGKPRRRQVRFTINDLRGHEIHNL